MVAYYGSHILHTAVAYFDVVLVEKGVILVLPKPQIAQTSVLIFHDIMLNLIQ